MASKSPIRRISQWDMYRLFDEGGYYRRLLSGEFQAVIEGLHPSTIISKRIPAGSLSGEVSYYKGQTLIAIVQNFVTPGGQIVASKKPDPRRIIINGVVYRRRRKKDTDTSRLTNREINTILGKTGWDARLTYPWCWIGIIQKFWKLHVRDRFLVPLGLAEER